MRVFKEALEVVGEQTISIPEGASLLHVDIQDGALCAWFMCDPSSRKVGRVILIYGTGHECKSQAHCHIGTVLAKGGSLVLHVFDGGELSG